MASIGSRSIRISAVLALEAPPAELGNEHVEPGFDRTRALVDHFQRVISMLQREVRALGVRISLVPVASSAVYGGLRKMT